MGKRSNKKQRRCDVVTWKRRKSADATSRRHHVSTYLYLSTQIAVNKTMRKCPKCLLPEAVPGSNFNADGICEPCRNYAKEDHSQNESKRLEYEKDLENAIEACRGVGEYDALVCFSGGKDSVYLLHRLVHDYKLKVLAYTGDFDIPDRTWTNIRMTIEKLKVEHYVHKPSLELYRRFIRYLLQNQNKHGAVHTVCYFWLDIREGHILKMALEKKIPLILTGYSPGQPDPERMLYEMPEQRIAREDWTPHELFENGLFQDSERDLFWNPKKYPEGTKFPRMLAPFHAWKYDQSEVMKKVVELGLVPNRLHANPILSNFSHNWLFMYSDLKNLGYNPYAPEFSQLIREGKASLKAWRILGPLVNFMIERQVLLGANVKKSLEWLDLKPEDLKITES